MQECREEERWGVLCSKRGTKGKLINYRISHRLPADPYDTWPGNKVTSSVLRVLLDFSYYDEKKVTLSVHVDRWLDFIACLLQQVNILEVEAGELFELPGCWGGGYQSSRRTHELFWCRRVCSLPLHLKPSEGSERERAREPTTWVTLPKLY